MEHAKYNDIEEVLKRLRAKEDNADLAYGVVSGGNGVSTGGAGAGTSGGDADGSRRLNEEQSSSRDLASTSTESLDGGVLIQGRQSEAEIHALHLVLAAMEVEINVLKKDGAKDVRIREPITIKDLSKHLHINSHGLQEIKMDLDPLKIQGSSSFLQRVEQIFTEYSFKINKQEFKKTAILKC
jgi:hypothetical protein